MPVVQPSPLNLINLIVRLRLHGFFPWSGLHVSHWPECDRHPYPVGSWVTQVVEVLLWGLFFVFLRFLLRLFLVYLHLLMEEWWLGMRSHVPSMLTLFGLLCWSCLFFWYLPLLCLFWDMMKLFLLLLHDAIYLPHFCSSPELNFNCHHDDHRNTKLPVCTTFLNEELPRRNIFPASPMIISKIQNIFNLLCHITTQY